MRAAVAVVCTLVSLAAVPAARADVTIGALPNPTDDRLCNPGGCTLAPDVVPGGTAVAPVAGVVTRWRVRTGGLTTPARVQVIRGDAEVGHSATVTPRTSSVTVSPTRIAIAQDDRIALECCDQTAGSFVVATAPAGTTDVWEPPLGTSPRAPDEPDGPLDVAVSADIEPDADGDVYGDETQDNCVGTANPDQAELDRDGVGDACDADDDGDGVPDASDACPTVSGPAAGCPAAPPPSARVNTPPVVRFRTPLAGTAVRASQAIELDVADDAGNPTVTVFDDDGTVCALSGPPYSCTWTPTGADVGRATLLASAVDSDSRSTLGIVRVTVSRFEADLTRRVRGRQVTGRLVLPAAVERTLGCRGEVTVRRGKLRRTVALKRNCSYTARLPKGRGKVRARFAGNPVVEPAT